MHLRFARPFPVLGVLLATFLAAPLLEEGVRGQAATIEWQVAFNRGSLQNFGPINVATTTVPAQTVIVPIAEVSGPLSITATIIGQEIPGIAPLRGRQLIVTDATASVAPGFFTPLNTPFQTIELLACYRFPLVAVGPPHTFGSRLSGFFDNIAGPLNDIDFARVEQTPQDGGCVMLAPEINLHSDVAFEELPIVPFDSGLLNHGFFRSQTAVIGLYHKFTLRNDGDTVNLPGSSEAGVQSTPEPRQTPALGGAGFAAMVAGLLVIGTFALFLRARAA